MPYRKPHTFRHNSASAMLNGSVPVGLVCGIPGHENPGITSNNSDKRHLSGDTERGQTQFHQYLRVGLHEGCHHRSHGIPGPLYRQKDARRWQLMPLLVSFRKKLL
ncbi:MAG TPA: hypothetical protein EYQ63_23405 [Fuerstia sp.]|nr:hypothetical protein [Fuerstiella sp.]